MFTVYPHLSELDGTAIGDSCGYVNHLDSMFYPEGLGNFSPRTSS